jgi:glucose/arabinose dehydrogenase
MWVQRGRRGRAWLATLVAWTLFAAGYSFAIVQPSTAAVAADGFVDVVALSGLNQPTNVEFSSDGRVFVAEKSGIIKVFDSLSDTTADVFADLRTETYNFWDRGLLGLALHPDFPATPYVYALYAYDFDPTLPGQFPRWGTPGATSDPCPTPPGPSTDGCVVTGRLTRLTASGNIATDPQVLVEDWCVQYPSHTIGDVKFGADGALYVSGGDGASFDFADVGDHGGNPCGDPPLEGGTLRAQDAETTGDPTGLGGSVIRIDPITGAAMPGNPFYGSGDANLDRIQAYGLRNPFRLAVDTATGDMLVGDVGWNGWEEINRIPTGGAAVNLGWPCYEGNGPQAIYSTFGLPICDSLYSRPGAVTYPDFLYPHFTHVVPGDGCAEDGYSTTGLTVYPGGSYDDAYDDAIFFGDYSQRCIWAIPRDGAALDTANIELIVGDADGPVDLAIGPNNDIFYVALNSGEIHRIVDSSSNVAPVAAVTADTPVGEAPLAVTFDASGSTDANPGDSLAYAWDLDDDGAFDDATGVTASRSYPLGVHVAHVRVTDLAGLSDVASIVVSAGMTEVPPTDDAGWQLNGSATPVACGIEITPPASDQAGSAFWSSPLPSSLVYASFDAFIGDGSGSDGMTLAIIDAAQGPAALGAGGGNLGFGGLSGVAVALDTYINPGEPGRDFIGVSASSIGDSLGYVATSVDMPLLNNNTTHVEVVLDSGELRVLVGGTVVITTPVTLPGDVLVGFTAGTGGTFNRHQACNVQIAGLGGAAGQLVVTPEAVDFGSVLTGSFAERDVTARNVGGLPITIDTSTLGSEPGFEIVTDIPAGTELGAGEQITGTLRFSPASVGAHTTTWSLGADGDAPTVVAAQGTGVLSGGPVPTIEAPDAAFRWAVGDPITFSGSAVSELGAPLPPSALTWDVIVRHCVPDGGCHAHPLQSFEGVAGATINAPDHEYPSYIELQLTATDNGTSTTVSQQVDPQTVGITLATEPPGLDLIIGSSAEIPTPFTRDVIAGTTTSIGAPAVQTTAAGTYTFTAWSDGVLTPTRTFDVGDEPLSFTALYDFDPTCGATSEVPGFTDPGWLLAGGSAVAGDTLVLNEETLLFGATSGFWSTPLASEGLTVCFEAELGPGEGADGLTLALLDAGAAPGGGVGAIGDGLGLAGLPAVGVSLDTWENADEPSGNFVGVVSSTPSAELLTLLGASSAVAELRERPVPVQVTVADGPRLVVTVDGAEVLDVAVPELAPSVLLGFTAGTGGIPDRHAINSVSVTTSGPAPTTELMAVPAGVDFGTVVVGSPASSSVTFTNTGTTPLTLAEPVMAGPGVALDAPIVAAGTVLAPGESVAQPVTWAPAAEGTLAGSLTLNAAELAAPTVVPLSGTAVAAPPVAECDTASDVPGFDDSGWTVAGSAAVAGTDLVLTTETGFLAGSGFWSTPMSSTDLDVCFVAQLGPGTGADGLTLALLDAAAAPGGGVGGFGEGLGLAGLPAVGVSLDTFMNGTDPSANFVGVVSSATGAPLTLLEATAPGAVRDLRSAPVEVRMSVVTGPRLVVTVDGVPVLDVAVPALAPSVLVGFTAGTGGLADRHVITGLSVGTGAPEPTTALTAAPTSVDFGTVVVGETATGTVTFTNTGTTALTLAAPVLSGAGVALADPVITGGTVLAPGAAVTQAVDYTPLAAGVLSGSLSLGATELAAPVAVSLSGVAEDVPPPPGACGATSVAPAFTDPSWVPRGTAAVVGDALVLNDAVEFSAGSSFWTDPLASEGLTVCFEAELGPGTGADGLALAFADAAAVPTGGLGEFGGGLGLAGLPAIGVSLDTFANTGEPSSNFVGVVSATAGAGGLTLLDAATLVDDLRAGPVLVQVSVTAGPRLLVSVGGTQVLDVAVPGLAPAVLVGFTAATGGTADRHAITALDVNGTPPGGGGTPAAAMSAAPSPLALGTVTVGESAAGSVTFTNTGTDPLTLTAPVVAGDDLALADPVVGAGTVLAPGETVSQGVTYAPTVAGPLNGSLSLGAAELTAPVTVTVTGSAVAAPPPPGVCGAASAAGTFVDPGWTLRGTAAVTGGELVLNEAAGFSAGSGFWSTPLASAGLGVCFVADLGPGTGADGMTLALVDAAIAPTGGLGGLGGGLGLAGVPAVGVSLDTFMNGADPSGNFVGVVSSTAGAADLTVLGSSTAIGDLRAGPVLVQVSVAAGPRLVVAVDGVEVLDVAVPSLAPSVVVGFTGATGGTADRHAVTEVVVTADGSTPGGGTTPPPAAAMTASPAGGVDFGAVDLGSAAAGSVTFTNTGTGPLTLTAPEVTGDGVVLLAPVVAAGTVLAAGESATQEVSYTPTAVGVLSGSLSLGADELGEPVVVALTGEGTTTPPPPEGCSGPSDVPSFDDPGWALRGAATFEDPELVLNDATPFASGSAFWSSALPAVGLDICFEALLGPGTGADGLTLAFVDAAVSPSGGLGGLGGALGLAGLEAVGVSLDTFANGGEPSDNFVGVVTSTAGAGALTLLDSSIDIDELQGDTVIVRVSVIEGPRLVVSVDGVQVLDVEVPSLAPTVVVGFTGATGGTADRHAIETVTIVSSGAGVAPTGTEGAPAAVAGAGLIFAVLPWLRRAPGRRRFSIRGRRQEP